MAEKITLWGYLIRKKSAILLPENSMADFSFARRKERKMISDILTHGAGRPPTPKEGELYKEITISGKIFQLRYGYYEAFERECPRTEPIPIYPDFTSQPDYTEEGVPIVTAMQNICKHYAGKADEDSSCADCRFFQKSEELFGLCQCPENKKEQ